MGSPTFPHQGSNKADALSTELRGRQFNGFGMLTPVTDLVNHALREVNLHSTTLKRQTKRDRPRGAISSRKKVKDKAIRPREFVPESPRTRDDRSARHQ
jgi:hypothetical protein